MRGYRYQSVGPEFADGNPEGGTNMEAINLELRQRVGTNLGFVTFVDSGGVSSTSGSVDRVGVGAGMRDYTSIGPIRLDFAIPTQRRPNDDRFEDLHRPRAGVLMPKWLRITAWSLGGLLFLVLLGVATMVVVGNTGGGRRLIETETAKLTSGRVRIAGFGGSFPADIEIASLELSDPKGVWLTAKGISLHWSPLALLAWDMHVESLGIGAADVARLAGQLSRDQQSEQLQLEHPRHRHRSDANRHSRARAGGSRHGGTPQCPRQSALSIDEGCAGESGRAPHQRHWRLRGHAGTSPLRNERQPQAGGACRRTARASAEFPGPRCPVGSRQARRPQKCGKAGASMHTSGIEANAAGTVDLVRRAADLSYSVGFSTHVAQARARLAANRATGTLGRPRDRASGHGVLDLEGLELAGRLAARLSAGESRCQSPSPDTARNSQ